MALLPFLLISLYCIKISYKKRTRAYALVRFYISYYAILSAY